MKHIKKKYLSQEKELPNYAKSIAIEINSPSEIKNSNYNQIYIKTEDDLIVKSFKFKRGLNECIIPIPDLTLVYFDGAYNLNSLRKEQEHLMFEKLKMTDESLGESAINEIYRYYGYASSCLISLFTALESFINHIIPDNIPYVVYDKKREERYKKDQIQRFLQFNDKVKDVLPFFFKEKNFFAKQTKYTQAIINLKQLRDEIVHPKSEQNLKNQEDLVKRVLNFKYDETFDAVAKFINYYSENLVEECNCGIDF